MYLEEISKANRERAEAWHVGATGEWNAADWSNAMAGEAGEVCNAVKKLRRIECGLAQAKGPHTREEALAEIATEIGDTFLYLDLLASHLGIDLGDAIRETFNRVSDREGFAPSPLSPTYSFSGRTARRLRWSSGRRTRRCSRPGPVAGVSSRT